jgi:hypothetical protein
MIRSQKPAPGGRGKGVPKWDYLPVANGKYELAFMAGPPCGCWTHHLYGTKPCKRMMTEGKLRCAFCEEKYEPVWRGAVPLYDREYTRRFVWITEDYYESTCEIKLHDMVKLTRDKLEKSPVVIRAEPWRTTPIPITPAREKAADLMPFLVRILWKDQELMEHAGQATITELVEEIGQEQKPKKRTIIDTITLALGDKAGEVKKVQDAKNREFAENARTTHQNGNGKPPPKG